MSKALFVCLTVLTAGERLGENSALEPEVYKPLPTLCSYGAVIDLQGVYQVLQDVVITVTRGCKLQGVAKGAIILLHAHLTFEETGSDDEPISLVGAIRFVGKKSFKQACVTVNGHLIIGGDDWDPDANVEFVSCHNKGTTSYGGALHVVNGLTVRSGFLTIRDSSSSAGGGGLYIHNDGLHQRGGKILLQNCGSDGHGGGLYAGTAGGLQQDAGDISCVGCTAAQHGGCLDIDGIARIGGSIYAEKCFAGSGGAVYVSGELVSWGLLELAGCRAKAGGGGGLLVKSDFTQHNGSMKFRSCAASEDGGAMDLGKNMYASGTMAFYACRADGDGGAINLQDDLQQAGTGNMSFASCAARRGGAVAVRRLETSGIVKFKDCHAADSGGAAVVETDFAQKAGRMEFESCTAGKSGGAAVIRGDLVSDGQCSVTACRAEEGSVLEVLGDITVQEFPADCPDGEKNLTGMFLVDWLPSLDGNCKVRGTGATVLLKEPLVFEGAVEFLGLITFIGLSPMEQACVTVHGSVTIGGSDEADILFADCHNEDNTSAGGALHIAQGLTVVSGALEIVQSSSLKGGGGIYVNNGSLHQMGGSIKMNTSNSEEFGGGLLINNGSLVQADGQISCHKCSAKRGGCLALNGVNYSLQTNGSIEAEDCTADAGGALHIAAGNLTSFGRIIFSRCHAQEGPGGAAWVRGTIFQRRGSMTFASCTAGSRGGGVEATGSFVQEGGSLSCQACNSQRGGGCMHVVDKFVQSKGGSANFKACNASGNGGALSIEKGVYLGGNSTFQDCSSTGHDGGCVHTMGHVEFQGSAMFTGCEAARDGGAVSARSAESGARITFDSCRAAWSGGGLYLEAFRQTGGSVTFAFCRTNIGSGGGLYLRGDFRQDGGHTGFDRCEADDGQGGGLCIEKGSLIQKAGTLDIESCKAGSAGGGGAVEFNVVQHGGKLSVANCYSKTDGGCLHIGGNFTQESRGVAHFSVCRAQLGGGCLGVKQSVHVEGSTSFQSCKAAGETRGSLVPDIPGGGGLLVHGDFFQNGGAIRFVSCMAAKGCGGGLQVLDGNLTAASGDMFFLQCWAQGAGGAYVKEGHVHTQAHATMRFKSCTASRGASGGGMGLQLGSLFQHGGHIRFSSCEAPGGKGGGLALLQGSLHQFTGSLGFEGCGSGEGGGLFVRKDVLMAGAVNFSNCKAHRQGGGLALLQGSLHQFSGSLGFEGCRSGEGGGGCMYVNHGELRLAGNLSMADCSSLGSGGGLLMTRGGVWQRETGTLTFDGCHAFGGNGGGMATCSIVSKGILGFSSCSAFQGGGGLYISTGNGSIQQDTGRLTFQNCTAGKRGGGFYLGSARPGKLGDVSFHRCTTDGNAGTIYAESDLLNVSNLTIFEPHSEDFDFISEGTLVLNDIHLPGMNQTFSVGIKARSLAAGVVNCTRLKSCSLAAPKYLLADLACPPGTGVEEGNGLKSCTACKDDYTNLESASGSNCVPCPTHTEFCYTTKFKMTAGHMVKQANISSTIFCPNPAACPGGVSTDFSRMCAEGYEGRACAYCKAGYAISDTSVLQCEYCTRVWWRLLLQWAFMLVKHVVPFAAASQSALQVEGAEEPKRSGVLLNQLMSFATVAGTLLTVAAQSSAIRDAKLKAASLTQAVIDAAGIATDFVSGTGSGGVGSSSACLLSFAGLHGKLWPAHLLHTAIPAAMVLVLVAFRPKAQHGVVLVVGLNCFWPVIFSYFGKYLYCFQFKPEITGLEKTYDCPFVNEESHRHVVRILMVSAFLAVSYVWIRLSLSEEDGAKPPLHVIFLSRAYRKSCRLWESERLMRKTLLTLAVSALPITSSPSLQLVCIATIVMGSLFLHAALLPYKTMSFNLTECTLLATAALMTAIVTGLTAYDHYWGRTMLVEYLMIFSVVGMATLTCAAMIFLIVK
ncbi:unnamed protein product, partial [Symbiodinium sp. CCMP2456]